MRTSIPADYHSHTHLCRHAGGRPIDYAQAAVARGIQEIACTEHIPFPNDPFPAIRMTMAELATYFDDVREAQDSFDLILGAVHSGPFWDLTPGCPTATPEFIEQMAHTYYQRMTELAQTGLYDICAHFDLLKRTGVFAPESLLAKIVPPALDAVAAADMAIEINTSGYDHGAGEAYPSLQILHWMRERDIPITFGSDAHSPSDVGRYFEDAVKLAREAGYTQRAIYRRRRRTLVPL